MPAQKSERKRKAWAITAIRTQPKIHTDQNTGCFVLHGLFVRTFDFELQLIQTSKYQKIQTQIQLLKSPNLSIFFSLSENHRHSYHNSKRYTIFYQFLFIYLFFKSMLIWFLGFLIFYFLIFLIIEWRLWFPFLVFAFDSTSRVSFFVCDFF